MRRRTACTPVPCTAPRRSATQTVLSGQTKHPLLGSQPQIGAVTHCGITDPLQRIKCKDGIRHDINRFHPLLRHIPSSEIASQLRVPFDWCWCMVVSSPLGIRPTGSSHEQTATPYPPKHQPVADSLLQRVKRAIIARKRTSNLPPNNPIPQLRAAVNSLTGKPKAKKSNRRK